MKVFQVIFEEYSCAPERSVIIAESSEAVMDLIQRTSRLSEHPIASVEEVDLERAHIVYTGFCWQ